MYRSLLHYWGQKMPKDWIITIIVALIAATPGFLALYVHRKKRTIDAATSYQAMADRQALQIDGLRRKIDELEAQVDCLEQNIRTCNKQQEEWRAGISLLINQLVSKGIDPIWHP